MLKSLLPAGLAGLLTFVSLPVAGQGPPPDTTDRALVQILAGALTASDPDIWPGYRLDRIPLLAYRAGEWAILVNPPRRPLEGWVDYPDPWPELGPPALFSPGGVDGLVGQLAFDYPIGDGRAVAVPLFAVIPPELGDRDRQMFAFLTHEAFHQYQRQSFRDIDAPSEEAYPILDAENNALAALELRAISEALDALVVGSDAAARAAAERAVAVHRTRWEALGDTARIIERTKEVVEGSAKYVEARSVGSLAHRCQEAAPGDRSVPGGLCASFHGETAASWLQADLGNRFAGAAIPPRDMARNRIYPLGAAIGLLLDRFAPGWKADVENGGTATGLFDRLADALGPQDAATRMAEARDRYDWDRVLEATRATIDEYTAGFQDAMARFQDRPGTRVAVELPVAGFSRGRSSREERWVVDAGRRTLGRFVTYTLRRRDPAIGLSIQDRVVLDERVAEGTRRVTVKVPGEIAVEVDGRPVELAEGTHPFGAVQLRADGVTLRSDAPGRLVIENGSVRVRLEP